MVPHYPSRDATLPHVKSHDVTSKLSFLSTDELVKNTPTTQILHETICNELRHNVGVKRGETLGHNGGSKEEDIVEYTEVIWETWSIARHHER